MFFIHIHRQPFYIPNWDFFALCEVIILFLDVGRGRGLLQQWWAPWTICSCILLMSSGPAHAPPQTFDFHLVMVASILWWMVYLSTQSQVFFSPIEQYCTIEIKYEPHRHFKIFLFITFEKVKQRTQMELTTVYCLYYKKSKILA